MILVPIFDQFLKMESLRNRNTCWLHCSLSDFDDCFPEGRIPLPKVKDWLGDLQLTPRSVILTALLNDQGSYKCGDCGQRPCFRRIHLWNTDICWTWRGACNSSKRQSWKVQLAFLALQNIRQGYIHLIKSKFQCLFSPNLRNNLRL